MENRFPVDRENHVYRGFKMAFFLMLLKLDVTNEFK